MYTKETLILLFEINFFDKKDAENIENNTYNADQLLQILDMAIDKETTIGVYSLSDFMGLCNNQEINLEDYWITYINHIK